METGAVHETNAVVRPVDTLFIFVGGPGATVGILLFYKQD